MKGTHLWTSVNNLSHRNGNRKTDAMFYRAWDRLKPTKKENE